MDVEPNGFSGWDWAVFTLSLVISLGVGVVASWQSRRKIKSDAQSNSQKAASEFLMGGRNMNFISIAISTFIGSMASTFLLGNTAEMYAYGTQLCMNVFGLALSFVFIHFVILKVLYPLKITSVYTYIQLRFKSSILTGFTIFTTMIGTFFYMGLCIYAPSLAMETVTGLPNWISVIIVGAICTIYSSWGGVRAVIYTDIFQTLITLFGMIIVIIAANVEVGGTQEVWRLANKYGRVEFFNMSIDPLERNTFWLVLIQGYFATMLVFGMGQPQVQRICSVGTWKKAIGAHYINMSLLLFLYCSVYYMGISIFAVYAGCDPMATGAITKPDQISPFYVDDKLSKWPGIPGLFIASLYAGGLSSYSSQINAVSAVFWEGYLKESKFVLKLSEAKRPLVNTSVSTLTGLLGILAGIAADKLGGLFQISQMILGTIHAPLLGLFILGMTCPWANKIGGSTGFTTSLIFNVWLTIGSFFFGTGHPTLPWTDDQCNATSINDTYSMNNYYINTYSINNDQSSIIYKDDSNDDPFPLYNMSYTLYGFCGVSITYFIGAIVSLISGPWNSEFIGERYIHPFFVKLEQKFRPSRGTKGNDIEL